MYTFQALFIFVKICNAMKAKHFHHLCGALSVYQLYYCDLSFFLFFTDRTLEQKNTLFFIELLYIYVQNNVESKKKPHK